MARLPRRRRDEGASALEFALLTPLILLITLLIVQYGLVFYGQQVAQAAAQDASRVARETPGNWQQAAIQKGQDSVAHYGPKLLSGVQVQPIWTRTEHGVEVSGDAVPVVPFFKYHIKVRSRGPIECFRPDLPQGGGTLCGKAGP